MKEPKFKIGDRVNVYFPTDELSEKGAITKIYGPMRAGSYSPLYGEFGYTVRGDSGSKYSVFEFHLKKIKKKKPTFKVGDRVNVYWTNAPVEKGTITSKPIIGFLLDTGEKHFSQSTILKKLKKKVKKEESKPKAEFKLGDRVKENEIELAEQKEEKKEPKFKVGDKVSVNWEDVGKKTGYTVMSCDYLEMSEVFCYELHAGADGWAPFVHEDIMELEHEEPKPKFKIGDNVKFYSGIEERYINGKIEKVNVFSNGVISYEFSMGDTTFCVSENYLSLSCNFDPTKSVRTRNGGKARILCTDLDDPLYPIAASFQSQDGTNHVSCFAINGQYNKDHEGNWDLVNIEKLTIIKDDNKPIPWRNDVSYYECEEECLRKLKKNIDK